MPMRNLALPLLLFVVCSILVLPACAEEPAKKINYQEHVRPILREHCFACHSQDDATSGLALDDYSAALAGGGGGEVLAAGDPDASRLWRLITHKESPKMPPGDKLPDDQLAVIKQWIEQGLLDNAGSKPKKVKRSGIGQMKTTTDNRPQGEPAMPVGLYREPVVTADRVGPVSSLAASPWAPLLAAPWQRQVSLYHTGDFRLLGVLPYPDGSPNVVRFSRDGALLLVAGGRDASSGSASVFDVKTGDRLVTVGDELDTVLAADISPDRSLVAIGGPKRIVRVYHTADAALAYEVRKHTDWVTALRFSPDGKLLASADRNAGLLLWQATTGNPRAELRGHKGPVTAVSWRADSAVIASSSEDSEVRLWRRDGRPIKNFRAHRGGAMTVEFARDGRLVTAGRDRRVALWSTEGKEIRRSKPMPDMALSAVFDFEGKRLIASDFSGAIKVIESETGASIADLRANPPTLAYRLAEAKSVSESLRPKLENATRRSRKAQQRLKDAEAAQAAYAQSLAEAQAALEAAKKQRSSGQNRLGESRRASDVGSKAFASAAEVRKVADQAYQVAKQQFAKTIKESEDTESSEAVLNSLAVALDLAKRHEANHARKQATVKKQLEQLEKALASAGAAMTQAEQKLATVESQRQALPDLAAAQSAAESAKKAQEEMARQYAETEASLQSIIAEQKSMQDSAARLSATLQSQAAERERLAAKVKETASAHASAAKAVEAEQAELDSLNDQLKRLQQKMEQRRELRDSKAQAAQKIRDKAEALQRQLESAEQAAQRAEARRKDFAAAKAEREKYLEKAP